MQFFAVFPAGAGGSHLAIFPDGSTEALAVFPPGGGNLTAVNLTLPGASHVLDASLSLEGLPSTLSGGRSDTTDDDFAAGEGQRNLTISGGSVRLSTASGYWAQSSDSDFRKGRIENVEIAGGVRLARGAKYPVLVEDRAVSPVYASQLRPVAATDSRGNLILAWEDLRGGSSLDLYARRFDPSGNPLGSDIVVCNAAGHQYGPALAVDSGDGFAVLWQDGRSGDFDIYGRRYDSSGNPLGSEFLVCTAPGDQSRPTVSIGAGNRMLAAWDDFRNGKNYAITTILLGSDGTPAGAETSLPAFNVDRMAPSVCTLPDGYALAYQNNTNLTGADIEGCLLDALGAPTGSFTVKYHNSNQTSVRIAPGPGGRFAAVWEDRMSERDLDIHGRWFTSTGLPAGAEVTLCVAAGDQRYPCISVSPTGESVVAWEDGRGADSDVYFERFDASWNAIGTETLACGEKRDQSTPAAGIDPSGGFFVAWSDWRDGLPNVHLKKFGNPRYAFTSGSLVSPPIACFAANYGTLGLCLTLPKAVGADRNTTGFQVDILDGLQDIMVQPDCRPGNSIAADTREHSSIRLRIRMWTADENITPVMGRWSVGTGIDDDLDCRGPAALTGTTLQNGEVTLEKTASPTTLTGDFAVKQGSTNDYQPSVAKFKDGSGSFIAAWQETVGGNPNILARKFSRDGTPLTGEIGVCTAPGVQESPSVAVDLNGQFTVVWSDNRSANDRDIYGRRFDAGGNPVGGEFLVCGTAEDQKTPRAATDLENSILVVWTDTAKASIMTFLRKFSPDGIPIYPTTQVSWTQWNLINPALDTDGQNRIYITWADFRGGTGANYDIYASVFHPDCQPVIAALDVEVCVKAGDQRAPDLSVDPDGDFVVVWEDWSNPNDPDVYGRKFDRNGTALTAEFPVAAASGTAQQEPEVEFDSRGNLLIIYQTFVRSYDICGRYFDSVGNPLSPEFVACDSPAFEGHPIEQLTPAVSWGPEDEFAVAWEDFRPETDMDIWAKNCGFPNYLASGSCTLAPYDLVHAPISLDEAGWNASLPAGTSVAAYLRTGPDGRSWSGWEAVSRLQSSFTSTPARFVQWQFALATTDGTAAPALQNLHLRYTTYATNGTLTSPPLEVPCRLSELRVSWNAPTGSGALAVEATQDNGTVWIPCESGEPAAIDVKADSSVLRYRFFLYSNGSGTPVLEDIALNWSATGYPLNPSLDLGGDGRTDWSWNGTFNRTVKVEGLETALNAALRSLGVSGSNVTLPLVLRSDAAGRIRISNLSVFYNVPPVIVAFEPSLDAPGIDEGGSLDFSVTAYDDDGDALSIVWTVNGRIVENAAARYEFVADFNSSGSWEIRAEVSDPFFSVNRTWSLTVRNVNRPPDLDWMPPGDPTINETEKVIFWATASDRDGDSINLTWSLDGATVSAESSWEYLADYDSSGVHEVSVRATDGTDRAWHNWTVTVLNRNRAPTIVSATPSPDQAIRAVQGRPVTFTIQAIDLDNDRLDFAWEVNGVRATGASGPVFTCVKGLTPGSNTVSVVVSDGNATAVQRWDLSVSPPPQEQVNASGPTVLIALAVIVVLAVLALMALLRWRKGKDTG